MRVLIACEYSGQMRRAFRAKGHEAWSCDVLPADDASHFHFQTDVREVLGMEWDLLIGHPPCTRLCNSGVRWLHAPPAGKTIDQMWRELDEATAFFSLLLNADIPHVAIENPVMHRYAKERISGYFDPGPAVQPWMHGHMQVKATCFWRRNLPPLTPTKNVRAEMLRLPYGERAKIHHASPGPDRW
ncbi:hypothetical protein, partial [Camelimonas fluminis]|uniref:hypothetical protein n=1 Tax=Camelimonas fluminis TaxID=1576911 RepID=UPI00174CAFBA